MGINGVPVPGKGCKKKKLYSETGQEYY